MIPASRAEAKRLNVTRYFTGLACKNGHIAQRITGSGSCVECRSIAKRAKTEANRAHAGLSPRYQPVDPADRKRHFAEYKRQWFEKNKERTLKRIADWAGNNTERVLAAKRRYRERHPVVDRVNTVKRRAAKLSSTPSWADHNIIKFFYTTRAYISMETGQQWHVDHIIPLRGQRVSGLHTHHNLRVIPAVENMKKGNRFE
jgi:hypothetical protein